MVGVEVIHSIWSKIPGAGFLTVGELFDLPSSTAGRLRRDTTEKLSGYDVGLNVDLLGTS